MTRCKNIRAMFADAVDGTLAEKQQETFHAHASRCAACREEFNAHKNAMEQLKASPLFDPGVKPLEAVFEALRGKQTVLHLPRPRRASFSRRLYASVFCAAALFFAYTGLFQKENKESDTQMAAFLMQNQTESFTLPETTVAFAGYDQLLAYGTTAQASWENVLSEFGL